MFIGTAPELEIALYTLCFFTRPNKKCKLSFAGIKFDIQTYMLQNNDLKFIATAFPIAKQNIILKYYFKLKYFNIIFLYHINQDKKL